MGTHYLFCGETRKYLSLYFSYLEQLILAEEFHNIILGVRKVLISKHIKTLMQ